MVHTVSKRIIFSNGINTRRLVLNNHIEFHQSSKMVDTTFYTSFRIRKQNAICAKYYIPLIIHHDFKAFRLEYANKCNVSIRQCFANVQYIKRQKNGIEIVYWNHFSHSNEHLLEFHQWLVGNWLYICMQWKLNWFFPLNGLEHTFISPSVSVLTILVSVRFQVIELST